LAAQPVTTGAWLRRFHPSHFRPLTRIIDKFGRNALPEGCTLADWPVTYDDLEPYCTRLEHLIGVAGDDPNPFIQRSKPLPMPAMRRFTLGDRFREATAARGLHPHPVPVGMNTIECDGRPRNDISPRCVTPWAAAPSRVARSGSAQAGSGRAR
jgi:gluconate 2-dehydrogenase alpha chain